MNRYNFKTLMIVVIMLLGLASASFGQGAGGPAYYGLRVGGGGIGIGTNYAKFTVAGTTGNTAILGTLTLCTNKFTVSALGAGNFASTLNCAGAFSVATNKFNVAQTGALTLCTDKFTVSAAGAGHFAGALNSAGAFSVTTNKFTVDTSGNTVVAGTLGVTGAVACASTITNKRVVDTTSLDTETTKTMNAATDLSGTVYISAAAGATTVTLPAVAGSAGASWEFIRSGAGNFIITGPAGTLVIDANAAATTATWSTPGHIIGSSAKVISDGAKWYIVNQGATTVTPS